MGSLEQKRYCPCAQWTVCFGVTQHSVRDVHGSVQNFFYFQNQLINKKCLLYLNLNLWTFF